jgi:hypothetical protein
MMDRNLSRRIRNVEKVLSKAEEIVSATRRKDEEWWLAYCEEIIRPKALLHATAVAAIVISGKPKIDKPLIQAWVRTLRHYGITIKNEYGREYEYERGHEHEYRFQYQYERELRDAHRELYPAIMQGADHTKKFTEIFKSAPVWLLEFTWMRLDAELLKFDLPRMAEKQVWGEKGLEDCLRWPLLPLGMMTDGDLVPEVAPESGVSPKDKEESRQLRRISEFIARHYPP